MPQPIVQQKMLFRVPVERAFEAFINPDVTTKFWFTHSDGPLQMGQTVTWKWSMYGCSTEVNVIDLTANESIKISWGDEGSRSNVTWSFDRRGEDSTLVTITNDQFGGDEDSIVAEAIDSMGGFSLVLAGAKAFLEHGIDLRLIEDHDPDSHVSS